MGMVEVQPITERNRRGRIIHRAETGRPTLYSDTLANAICQSLTDGVTRQCAAAANGIDDVTFRDWMSTREAFALQVARAEAEAEVRFTQSMMRAATEAEGKGDWRAAESWLKRRRRAEYGDTLDIRKVDADLLRELLNAQSQGTTEADPALLLGDDVL